MYHKTKRDIVLASLCCLTCWEASICLLTSVLLGLLDLADEH